MLSIRIISGGSIRQGVAQDGAKKAPFGAYILVESVPFHRLRQIKFIERMFDHFPILVLSPNIQRIIFGKLI